MDYKQVEKDIQRHILEKIGYEYNVLIIHGEGNIRLLIDSDNYGKETYKETAIQFFTRLINAASSCQWTRRVGESTWVLLSEKNT